MKRITIFSFAALIFAAAPAAAQTAGGITVDQPFSRATPGGAKVGGGYMTLINKGAADDKLVSAASPAAERVEIHEMKMQGDVMKMAELPGGLPVAAGKTVSLAPGGYHLMLMNLKAPLQAGDKVPVTLTFEKAGKLEVTLSVRAMSAQPPSSSSSSNQTHRH